MPTQSITDKEAATDGWLQRRQVKIYRKQEQPVLTTTFEKGVAGGEQKPPFQMLAATSGRQKKSFFKPEIFLLTYYPPISTDRIASWKTFNMKE